MRIEQPDSEAVDDIVDDWEALAQEQREFGSHILPGPNRERIHRMMTRYAVTGGLLVARKGGEVVGFVMFSPERNGYVQAIDRGAVEYLYVSPEWRGHGHGSDLLDRAEAALREAGADAITLEVMAQNEAARDFYRSHGYAAHRVQLEKRSDTHTKE